MSQKIIFHSNPCRAAHVSSIQQWKLEVREDFVSPFCSCNARRPLPPQADIPACHHSLVEQIICIKQPIRAKLPQMESSRRWKNSLSRLIILSDNNEGNGRLFLNK